MYMQKYYFSKLTNKNREMLCSRAAVNFTAILETIKPILQKVRSEGDEALLEYTALFDKVTLKELVVSESETASGVAQVAPRLTAAIQNAANNIRRFHEAQLTQKISVETMPGILCSRESRPIERVGLYIPGGSAPLPSTVLMLGIPAQLAGCKEVILCTPPQKDGAVDPTILYAAQVCGITKIIKVGGAQAVAALAYGTASVPKVSKIFGPGNQYVTAAKMLVSVDPQGAAIDIPAGPSEILVIADTEARADFVAADLLSQAEHGPDSQAVLVCTDEQKTDEILKEVDRQLSELPRQTIARQALEKSFAIVTSTVAEAITFSNQYAPEHLLLNVKDAESYTAAIQNAGSVFVGAYASESAGDYASGTNHTLPTSGYAQMYSGVSVDSFLKYITFQQVTAAGVKNIGPIVTTIAKAEGLAGHERAMQLRIDSLKTLWII